MVKWNPVGTGRVDTRDSQWGKPGKAQMASFKGYNQRAGLGSHQRGRDMSNIKYSGDGKRKLHPVLLEQQDVCWQNQAWNFPTQNESGDKTGDQRQEVNKGPKAAGTHDAYGTVKPNWIVSQLVRKHHETNESSPKSEKCGGS